MGRFVKGRDSAPQQSSISSIRLSRTDRPLTGLLTKSRSQKILYSARPLDKIIVTLRDGAPSITDELVSIPETRVDSALARTIKSL